MHDSLKLLPLSLRLSRSIALLCYFQPHVRYRHFVTGAQTVIAAETDACDVTLPAINNSDRTVDAAANA